jgi:hypothetical protein
MVERAKQGFEIGATVLRQRLRRYGGHGAVEFRVGPTVVEGKHTEMIFVRTSHESPFPAIRKAAVRG